MKRVANMLNNFIFNQIIVKDFGNNCDYPAIWQRAIDFSKTRDANTLDELWLFECTSVFTRGTTSPGNDTIIDPGDIPIVQMDRDGGNAYHGPGQLMFGVVLDLNRLNFTPVKLLCVLYHTLSQLLAYYKIDSKMRNEQRRVGPFVDGNKKIGFVDLGVYNNYCYHGLSLNVDMDLSPFAKIDPCGIKGFEVTHLKNYVPQVDWQEIKQKLVDLFVQQMQYSLQLWQKTSV